MKKITIISVLAIAVIMASCSQENKEAKKIEDTKDAFTLTKQVVNKTLNLPAELLPYERAEINAKVEGYVQKVLVDIGDEVRKGEVLAVLEAPEVAAHYAEANAKYNEAAARYRASLDKSDRIRNASKQKGVVAEAELINIENVMLADSAALNSAESMAQAYKQLQAYLTIRAPFNGVVTERFIDTGDLVGSTGKAALLTIERPDKLRLRVHVPESYVNSVPANDSLVFAADAVVDKNFTAKLARKAGSINRETRTELWEYEYNNKDNELKPGMYTMARLNLSRTAGSFVVPYSAVVTSLEKKFVIRVNNGKAGWVDVREGISQENGLEIFGDLQEGDTLLTRASDELEAGTNVKINIQ